MNENKNSNKKRVNNKRNIKINKENASYKKRKGIRYICAWAAMGDDVGAPNIGKLRLLLKMGRKKGWNIVEWLVLALEES